MWTTMTNEGKSAAIETAVEEASTAACWHGAVVIPMRCFGLFEEHVNDSILFNREGPKKSKRK